jgi:hypothetical protein
LNAARAQHEDAAETLLSRQVTHSNHLRTAGAGIQEFASLEPPKNAILSAMPH